MSHAKQIIKDGISLVTIQFIGTLLSVVTTAYIARLFSTTEMAVYGTFYIIYGIMALLRGLGLADCLIKHFPALITQDKQKEAYRLAKTIFFATSLTSLILVIIVTLSSAFIAEVLLKTKDFSSVIRLFTPGLFFYGLFEINLTILWARQKLTSYALYQTGLTLFSQLMAIIGWYIDGMNGFIIGFSGAIILVSILSMIPNFPLLRINGYAELRSLVKYCFPFYLSTFARYGFTQADQLLVGIFLSPLMLGIYFFIKRFADQLRVFLDSSFLPLSPKLSEMSVGDTQNIKHGLIEGVRLIAEAIIPLVILVAASSRLIITIFGGDKYLMGTLPLVFLITSLILYSYYSLVAITLYIFKEPMERFKIEIIPGVINIILLIILVPLFNLEGAVIAMIIALLVGLWWGTKRIMGLEVGFVFPWVMPIKVLLRWLPLGYIIYLVQNTYHSLTISIIISLVGGVFYLFYLWRSNFYKILL